MGVVNKTKCIRHPAFFFMPLVFPMFLPDSETSLSSWRTTTSTCPVSNSCTSPGLQPRHRADQCWGLRRQQRPLLPQGGEGHLQEQVRALQGENLLDTERGDLQSSYVQELYRGHRDQH